MTPVEIGTSALTAVQTGIVTAYGAYFPPVVAFLVALFPLVLIARFIKGKLGRGKVAHL